MQTPIVIFSALILVILIVALVMMFFGKGKEKEAIPDQEDELVYDEISGKYVTVEELVTSQELEMATEEDAARIWNNLSEPLKESITPRDVFRILEFHYQGRAMSAEDDPYIPETAALVLEDMFRKKDRNISADTIVEVIRKI